MLHKLIEYTKEEAIIERVHGALFILKCPECGKEHGSASEPDFLPDLLWCWGEPTHEDWKAYKKERGLKNEDIAKIVGSTADSVKSMTQPNKELPKWAISMLYEWKRKSNLFPKISKDNFSDGVSFLLACNVISLGEVADFGKINFQLKNKYDAKRKYE